MSKQVSKSKLKARMLQIFRDLEAGGGELIVTDRGKPVLRITPYEKNGALEDLFGNIQGQVIYHEDIDTPTTEEWANV